MKILSTSCLVLVGIGAFAGLAYAQVPSTNDTSDTNQNTGMGSGALGGPAASNVGNNNTASGYKALYSNTTGGDNTASGYAALFYNTGDNNTASGSSALAGNTSGSGNTASGSSALAGNTSGSGNTASGLYALSNNATANYNTASGFLALYGTYSVDSVDTGSNNTGIGAFALYSYSTGSANTASGMNALYSNTTGVNNTASGFSALYTNTTGNNNTATGTNALYSNQNGDFNTASGQAALHNNTTGQSNIAMGYQAGYNLTTGSHNIDIGNKGVAGDTGIIRIGTQVPSALQTATFIAGIYGVSVSGSPVYVASNGHLGTVVSSERFKTAIAPMGSSTTKLARLRPVTFQLKTDPEGTQQYGLIAEEVAKVYPELVIRGEDARIDGVRYDELAPMLLNEVQKQATEIQELKKQRIADQAAIAARVEQEVRAALSKLHNTM